MRWGVAFLLGRKAWKGRAGCGAHFPAQLGSKQRIKQEIASACNAWSLPLVFFPAQQAMAGGRSCEQCCGFVRHGCLELRLLPQPRPIGYKFLGPFKSLGASPPTPREAGLDTGCLPSRWWELPALRAICPVGGVLQAAAQFNEGHGEKMIALNF